MFFFSEKEKKNLNKIRWKIVVDDRVKSWSVQMATLLLAPGKEIRKERSH